MSDFETDLIPAPSRRTLFFIYHIIAIFFSDTKRIQMHENTYKLGSRRKFGHNSITRIISDYGCFEKMHARFSQADTKIATCHFTFIWFIVE